MVVKPFQAPPPPMQRTRRVAAPPEYHPTPPPAVVEMGPPVPGPSPVQPQPVPGPHPGGPPAPEPDLSPIRPVPAQVVTATGLRPASQRPPAPVPAPAPEPAPEVPHFPTPPGVNPELVQKIAPQVVARLPDPPAPQPEVAQRVAPQPVPASAPQPVPQQSVAQPDPVPRIPPQPITPIEPTPAPQPQVVQRIPPQPVPAAAPIPSGPPQIPHPAGPAPVESGPVSIPAPQATVEAFAVAEGSSAKAVAPPVPAKRVISADELITDLFEAMHDLEFVRSAHEGADFVLTLTLEKFRSATGIVQLYDINRREFVISHAVGPNAGMVLGGRTSERDPLVREIMKRRRPFVLDVSHDARVRAGRWAALGPRPQLLLAAAVEQGGRFLGIIEIASPIDGNYEQFHLDAMSYVAEHFAEFVARCGLVFASEPEPAQ